MSNRSNVNNFKSVDWTKLENLIGDLDNFRKTPFKEQNTKTKAFDHLSLEINQTGLTKRIQRQLIAKTKKIKKSVKKDDRQRKATLIKEVNWFLHNV